VPDTQDTRGTRLRVHSEGVYNVAPPLHVVPGIMRQRVERPSCGLRANCRPSPAVRERCWRNFARTGYKKRARASAHTPPPRLNTHPIPRKTRSPGRLQTLDFAPPRVPVPNPDTDPTPAEARANPTRRAPRRRHRRAPRWISKRKARRARGPSKPGKRSRSRFHVGSFNVRGLRNPDES
jgi:hypothetical protein